MDTHSHSALVSDAITDVELQMLRAETPSASAFVHFNHASNSLQSNAVLQVQRDYFELEARLGNHRAVAAVTDRLAGVHAALANFLNVSDHQIAITESASRGWALALSALAPAKPLQVFVSSHEWGGNVGDVLAQQRMATVIIPGGPEQRWRDAVEKALAARRKDAIPVVALPLIGSASGVIHDLDGVAEVIKAAGGWFFVDASQAAGQIPVDAATIGADVLVFPSRKWLRGPRGLAVLCLSERALCELETPALLDIRGGRVRVTEGAMTLTPSGDASRFELFEHHPGLRLGLLAAIEGVNAIGVKRIQAYTLKLCERLHRQLQDRWPVVHCAAPTSALLCASSRIIDAGRVVSDLWNLGFNIANVAPHYAPLAMQDRSVAVLRFSPHVVTLPEEVDRLVDALSTCGI